MEGFLSRPLLLVLLIVVLKVCHAAAPEDKWKQHVELFWNGSQQVLRDGARRARFDQVYHLVVKHNSEYRQGLHTFFLTYKVPHASLPTGRRVGARRDRPSWSTQPPRVSAATSSASSSNSPSGDFHDSSRRGLLRLEAHGLKAESVQTQSSDGQSSDLQYQLGLSLASSASVSLPERFFRYATSIVDPSKPVNWNASGYVTPVPDQGDCAAGWSFAVTGAVESVNAIMTGPSTLTKLSDQELLDCQNGDGCNGGWPDAALSYIINNGGLDSAQDYPYTNSSDSWCDSGKQSRQAQGITQYEKVPAQDEDSLLRAVASQPVIVYVQADQDVFQFYGGGVINSASCGNDPNHVVLIVGYGFDSVSNLPFWLIRNSWGTSWGESGFVRVARGSPAGGGKATALLGGGAGGGGGPGGGGDGGGGGMKAAGVGGKSGILDGVCGILSTSPVFPVLGGTSPGGPKGVNPCTPNPCGAGTCVPSNFVDGQFSCNCPASLGLIAVSNSAPGTQTCALVDVCGSRAWNPCGAGTCSNDGQGGYNCNCTGAYIAGTLSDGSPTCVAGGNGGGTQTYVVKQGDFCAKIWVYFGLTNDQFTTANPGIDCNNLQPGQVVIVSLGSGSIPCTSWYQWQAADFCFAILRKFSLTKQSFLALNPNLPSCSSVTTGLLVCVAGPSAQQPGPKRCGRVVSLSAADVNQTTPCSSLSRKYNLRVATLLNLNPGIKCDRLRPGTKVCVAVASGQPQCATSYRVQMLDSCWSIAESSGISLLQFNSLNPGVNCNLLQLGQTVCTK